MWQGKKKAVTFSYDDGVTQDIRLIEMMDKYGLKCTFNLNSMRLGQSGELVREGVTVSHCKVRKEDVKSIYAGHEVAGHTLTHPMLTKLSDEDVVRETQEDILRLSEYVGEDVVGFAYPGGGVNYNSRVAELIRTRTDIKYARTTLLSDSFSMPSEEEMFVFKPTAYHRDFDALYRLGEKFLTCNCEEPVLLYIWGHSYEFDIADTWAKFEEFLSFISGKSDVFYGTNRQVFGV